MSESFISKQLLQATEDNTPLKMEVQCEINAWGQTLQKEHPKNAFRHRKHRKVNSNNVISSHRFSKPEINGTPLIEHLKRQRNQLMKETQQKQKVLREETKPTSKNASRSSRISSFGQLEKKSIVKVNQFRVQGEKKRKSIDTRAIPNYPKQYRKMSMHYRRKSRELQKQNQNSDNNTIIDSSNLTHKRDITFDILKKKFGKKVNCSKWILEINKSQDY